MPIRLSGLIAATHTPFDTSGALHLAKVASIVEHVIGAGVSGLYVLGSTGEGQSLTTEERKRTAEAFVRAVGGRRPVIVQVGHNSLEESRELATHAQTIGADMISATAPSYFKLNSSQTLVACLARVAGGAPNLPFYYYHIPSLVNVPIDLATCLQDIGDRIPNFRGVKYTAPTLWEYQACRAACDERFDCVFGVDEMLLPALSVGAKAAIGSTYNFAAPLYQRIIDAFQVGNLDEAQAWQARAVAMVRVLVRRGGAPAIKAAMKLVGIDCGPVRLPLEALNAEEIQAMERELADLGFFDWVRLALTT